MDSPSYVPYSRLSDARETRMQPQSSIFPLQPVQFSTGEELVLRGGRELFPLLPQAFEGINQIGFIGWGSQAPAQSQNLRDSLATVGSDILVKVGLRLDSKSVASAHAAGFTVDGSTLGEMFEVANTSDFIIVLISDGAMTKLWKPITEAMKPGATLGLSHGFLFGYLESIGEKLRTDINVILMAPKGMGPSVRLLYLQGKETEGAGINSSDAVEQDVGGRAMDYALAWAVGTGSPSTFFTTMRNEVISDLTGERAMLLGGLWGLSEALYALFLSQGMKPEAAFLNSVKGLTSTVTRMISERGLKGLAEIIETYQCGAEFRNGYNMAYPVMDRIIREIYTKVASWQEIGEVVKETSALEHTPMSNIEASDMWKLDKSLYAAEAPVTPELAFAAGAFVAGVMAQMRILREHGHGTSEIANESLIEIVDSLIPFMDKCWVTARLGTRAWGPWFRQNLAKRLKSVPSSWETESYDTFLGDSLHGDIALCFQFRPPVRISVV